MHRMFTVQPFCGTRIMKIIKLDSVLLFALVIPFIMGFRVGPGETPYLLFAGIFLLLFLNLGLDLLHVKAALYEKLKSSILWITILVVVGSAFSSAIIVRHQTAPIYMVHDIILQQEAAIRFLLHGKNPYKETYFGTPLEAWHYSDNEVNPALYHFVMEPFYLLFTLPFYFAGNLLFGYFDARMPLFVLFVSLFVLASILVKDHDKKRLFIILLAFHPSILPYTLEGRSDIFMFAFLFAGLVFLYWKRYGLAGIALGLAAAIKQSAWPLLPFYFVYLYFKFKSIKLMIVHAAPLLITFFLITLPFFVWDSGAFIRSTILYLSGNTEHSYPISGYGLGSLLLQYGVISDKFSSYPFLIWQFVICVPLFVVLIRFMKKNPTIKNMIISYAVFLFIYWYLSRYFNNSHIAYVSYVLIVAYFWPENDRDNPVKAADSLS